jgi:hypothetical protein
MKQISDYTSDRVFEGKRVLTEEEALALCDIDNNYTNEWTVDQKVKAFFTKEGEGRVL